MARVVDLGREVGAVEPRGQLLPEPGGLVGRDARAADPAVEQPADRQRLVAEELGLEPEPRPARQEPVLRVLRGQRRASRPTPGGRSPR